MIEDIDYHGHGIEMDDTIARANALLPVPVTPVPARGESMTKAELLALLASCNTFNDPERAHGEADDALIAFINDPEITAAYEAVNKWYA